MLMIMYWGANEATSAIAKFLGDYERHLHLLMDYRPTAQGHEALVSGLVLRYFQAHNNLWIHQQLASDSLIPFQSGVHDLWTQLSLQSHIWERPFPLRYITLAAPLPGLGNLSAPGGLIYGANTTVPLTNSAAPSEAAAPAPRVQETHRNIQETHWNMYPNGNEEAFKVYRTLRIGCKFKKVVNAGVQNGHPIPKNGRGNDM
jgi:hypothetical protein